MTNDTQDLIRRAAEYTDFCFMPAQGLEARWYLHALTGLVEDKLRNETATPIQTQEAIRKGLEDEWVSDGEPPDYLIARLDVLMQLVEKLEAAVT